MRKRTVDFRATQSLHFLVWPLHWGHQDCHLSQESFLLDFKFLFDILHKAGNTMIDWDVLCTLHFQYCLNYLTVLFLCLFEIMPEIGGQLLYNVTYYIDQNQILLAFEHLIINRALLNFDMGVATKHMTFPLHSYGPKICSHSMFE